MRQSKKLVWVPKGPSMSRNQATMLWLDLYAEEGTRFKLSACSKKKMGQTGKTCGLMIVGRGISSRNDSHTTIPLPERAGDVLPFPFIQTFSRAIDSYLTSSSGPESASTTTEEEPQTALVNPINNGWTPRTPGASGNSTERSSLFSWGDDEFDKISAKRVQRMFDEIDSMLYEGQKISLSSSQLHNECKVWKTRFPHLRILGSQLIAPSDEGFQLYPQDEPSSPTTGVLLDIADHEVPGRSTQNRHGLKLSGHHIRPIPSVDTPSYPEMTVVDHANTLEEEIIESDGTVEEFFAYDKARQTDDDYLERKLYHTVPRREGFPPLTPSACIQNTVLSQTFDVLWAEVVTWMRLLIKIHHEDKEKNLVSRPAVEPDHPDPNMTPIMAPTFVIPLSPSPLGVTTGRFMDPPRKLAPMGSFRVGPSANWQARKSNSLTSVMTISSKALHNRQGEKDRVPSAMTEESPVLPATQTRPNSSSLAINKGSSSSRPTSTRISDVHPHRLSSATVVKGRLRPIERVKTPSVPNGMDALITGKRMMTANNRLNSPPHPMAASPPHQWSRNTMLPPIESVQENGLHREYQRPPTSSGKWDQGSGTIRHRISSAVIDGGGQRPNKNLQPFPYNDSRPNTTHSFRDRSADVMLARRSSTPQSIANIFKAASGTMQGVPGQLNDLGVITGRGINPGGLSQLEGNIGNSQYGSQQQSYLKTL